VALYHDTQTGATLTNFSSYFTYDNWNYITIVSYRSTNGGTKVFKNGVEVGAAASRYLMVGNENMFYIKLVNTVYDDLAVWRRALTGAEITQMYNRTATGKHYFIPTKTATEWNAFLAHMPTGTLTRECYCAVGYYRSSASDTCVVTPAGYYSPVNDPRLYPCGSCSYYCPGSVDRQTIGAGYYASAFASTNYYNETVTARTICGSGNYCTGDGYANSPTSGYYLSPLSCSTGCTGQAICEAGYYCSSGTRSSISYSSGYCGTVGQATCITNGTGCAGQQLAPAGQYAMQSTYPGMCANCAAGYYGSSTGLKVSTCTGQCFPGYYCPAGTSDPSTNLCPQDSYCPTGAASPTACTSGLASPPGSYQASQCITPITNSCGSLVNRKTCWDSTYNWATTDNFWSSQSSAANCQAWCNAIDYGKDYCCSWDSSTLDCTTALKEFPNSVITTAISPSNTINAAVCTPQ
jgi:hypothetical protein